MKKILQIYLELKPAVMFLPFLILYVLIILKVSTHELVGDEGRYYEFANNLLNGYYSPPAPNINLWSGPGYPIFLVPFVWLKMPLLVIKLANAFLQYFSIVLLFLAINKYTSKTYALILSFFWALYYISYQELPLMLTEPLTSFLSALIVFFIAQTNSSESSKTKYFVLAGFAIGFLSLTKIIFGYVILSLIMFYGLLLLFRKSKNEGRKGFFVIMVALLINVPYLIYTYNLTGKVFYWGNSGGSSLYWMSTPIEGEFGEWNNATFTANYGHDPKIPNNASLFAINHQKDMDYVAQYPVINQDDQLKKIAFNNIKTHPVKYLRNCVSNVSRIFFGIPNSYFYQREQTAMRLLPNSIILSLLIFCSIITAINFRTIKPEIRMVIGLTFLYLFFSTLVSAYPRQLYVIIPFLFFWASYIMHKSLTFTLKFSKEE